MVFFCHNTADICIPDHDLPPTPPLVGEVPIAPPLGGGAPTPPPLVAADVPYPLGDKGATREVTVEVDQGMLHSNTKTVEIKLFDPVLY